MDELKACPFCGAELDKHGCLTRNGVVTDYYIHPAPDEVRDDECPLCGCVFRAATWNRRPLEDALQAEIERMREAQRWIPVGERLPEEPTSDDDDTFICLIRGISFYGDVYLVTKVLRFYGEKFYSIGHFSTDWTDQVVAWMPLPEPPQEAEGN